MKILLTGGTGLIGSAVLAKALADGHDVTAVVRSATSGAVVTTAGATALEGDLTDVDWLAERLREHDAAVHTASPGDATSAALDDAVVSAVIEAFGGTDKPFVHTGGVWNYGDGDAITEESPDRPVALTAWRLPIEERLLTSGVKASVVQPGIVHGRGLGLPNLLVAGPRDADGALTLVGSGDQHWTTIQVDDLADLYLAALTEAPGGEKYLGVSDHSPTVRELGQAVVGADGTVVPESADAAKARLGEAFAEALLLDQRSAPARATERFGWTPSRPTLVEELAAGYADE